MVSFKTLTTAEGDSTNKKQEMSFKKTNGVRLKKEKNNTRLRTCT